jgi:pyruvate kinase
VTDNVSKFSETVRDAVAHVKSLGLGDDGDKVVITAGVPFGSSGTTNTLRIAVLGDKIIDA